MKKLTTLLVATFLLSVCGAKPTTLKSPNGKVVTQFFVENGKMFYNISLNGKIVIEQSPLGLTATSQDFTSGITLANVSLNGNIVVEQSKLEQPTASQDFTSGLTLAKISKQTPLVWQYTLEVGKRRNIKYSANQIVYTLSNSKSQTIEVTFRASNDGVAYRYSLVGAGQAEVLSENSGFKLPEASLAFITPMSKAKTGFAKTNPSYEENYHLGQKVGTPSNYGEGWTYPALFKVDDNSWVMISETNVNRNYVATHLDHLSPGGLYMVEFPAADQNLLTDPTSATVELPAKTPWRTINVGDLGTIVESTMAQDLAEPQYEAKYVNKPGRASWSWVILKDDNILYDVQKRYIDMAAQLGWEYCLVDAPWDVQIGREKIAELSAYAQSKGVALLLWYNSNGKWNDAPQTPKDCMDTHEARVKEMAWMQSIGVRGIKVDFFGGDKQRVMEYYDDILRDANDYGLAVNFHGTTLPRGWERMYPNFLTNEAVKGQEFITFDQSTADRQAEHCATLMFTRNVVGPMDFTPIALNARLGVNPDSGPVRRTTAGFELALGVIFFSGIQHFALVPENLDQFPQFVTTYLKNLPTVWDDTKFLAGYPGKNGVIARRKGGKWYIAGINGQSEKSTLTFDLPFVTTRKEGKIITDLDQWNKVTEYKVTLTPGDKFEVELKPNGGFVMVIE